MMASPAGVLPSLARESGVFRAQISLDRAGLGSKGRANRSHAITGHNRACRPKAAGYLPDAANLTGGALKGTRRRGRATPRRALTVPPRKFLRATPQDCNTLQDHALSV